MNIFNITHAPGNIDRDIRARFGDTPFNLIHVDTEGERIPAGCYLPAFVEPCPLSPDSVRIALFDNAATELFALWIDAPAFLAAINAANPWAPVPA